MRQSEGVGTRILAVEDDERIRAAVKLALEDEGWTVAEAANGEDALAAFQQEPADVVLIDIMLPDIDGFEVCRAIRRSSDVPIVMVTARDDTHDIVAGLEAGADDYLTKPFAPKELSARIRALLRRARTADVSSPHLRFGDLEIVPEEGVVRRNGRDVHLTKTEFRLLVELAQSPGRVFSREVLLERMFGELNEKQDDYLKDIHSSGKHLLTLINDILDLSKVEAGRMELEPARFDVPTAIGNAMTLVRERAQRHGIALGIDVAAEVGEIVADERKFKQILLNLLTNAVKFTPDGGRVDVLARRTTDALEVAVRDTGIGIAKEDQAAVFEEFRQVGRHYTNKQEGTGLGLALTRRFVELHGGAIRLESEPGKGSTFTFTIPHRA